MQIDPTTLAGAGLTIASGLGTAIAAVWKRLNNKLDQCEEKHGEAQSELVTLSNRVGRLEGAASTFQQVKEHMDALPGQVAEKLKES